MAQASEETVIERSLPTEEIPPVLGRRLRDSSRSVQTLEPITDATCSTPHWAGPTGAPICAVMCALNRRSRVVLARRSVRGAETQILPGSSSPDTVVDRLIVVPPPRRGLVAYA